VAAIAPVPGGLIHRYAGPRDFQRPIVVCFELFYPSLVLPLAWLRVEIWFASNTSKDNLIFVGSIIVGSSTIERSCKWRYVVSLIAMSLVPVLVLPSQVTTKVASQWVQDRARLEGPCTWCPFKLLGNVYLYPLLSLQRICSFLSSAFTTAVFLFQAGTICSACYYLNIDMIGLSAKPREGWIRTWRGVGTRCSCWRL